MTYTPDFEIIRDWQLVSNVSLEEWLEMSPEFREVVVAAARDARQVKIGWLLESVAQSLEMVGVDTKTAKFEDALAKLRRKMRGGGRT